jgi:SSS family solute:Na+ symporter
VLSIISLVAYVLTKMAVGIFAGGVVFASLLPELRWDFGFMVMDSFWIGSVAVVVLTGLYTVLGGLRAVAYADGAQTIILILGSFLVTFFGLAKLGGWQVLRDVCGPEMFNLWKPLVPQGMEATWVPVKEAHRIAWYFNGNYPWLGMLFCAPITGLWYWCTDQYIVQRALGAPNEQQARRGTIFAGLLKLLPVIIFIVPGMTCFALAKSGRLESLHTALYANGQLVAERAQAAFPLMVQHVLPMGVRGIVVAGLLSALMSSLAGAFNASSTLFTMDLYKKFRPRATEHQLVWTGRLATAGMVLIALLWIPVIQGAQGLYHYLQGVQGYLAPPIFVVFFFGIFMKRLNHKGCLAALLTGFGLGVLRLAIDTPVALKLSGFENGYTQGSLPWILNNINFQYYSLIIFLVSVAAMFAVSYATEAPELAKLQGLTYATVSKEQRQRSRSSWGWGDVAASALILMIILAAYLYFNG